METEVVIIMYKSGKIIVYRKDSEVLLDELINNFDLIQETYLATLEEE